MNQPNNKRRKASQKKIEKVFVESIQTKEINEITVTAICKKAKINRTTFYSNYLDLYDLADKIREKLEHEVRKLYQEEREQKQNSNDFLKLFKHIKENQIFYCTYFKLGFDRSSLFEEYDINLANRYYQGKNLPYHFEFFKAGLNAVLKKWLSNNCQESPEEIFEIIKTEYQK